MTVKPVDMMHSIFGKTTGKKCGDCPSLMEAYYGDRKVRKCRAYGGFHSSKADWALKWEACGQFGRFSRGPVVTNAQKSAFMRRRKVIERGEVQGQIGMEE